MEKYFIKKFNSVDSGYNLTFGGDVFTLSDETKSKISKSKQGQGKGHIRNSLSVLQFTLDGQFIKQWDAINVAARELKIAPIGISKVCRYKQQTAGGYL